MTREQLHTWVDEQLDAMGFKNTVTIPWGSIMLQVNFENGREVITIRERETVKEKK